MAKLIDMGVDLSDRCAHLAARRVNLVELLSCLPRRPIFFVGFAEFAFDAEKLKY